MTIQKAFALGVKRLWREPWSKTSWCEFTAVSGEGSSRRHGPWLKVVTLGVEPGQVGIWEVPQDGWHDLDVMIMRDDLAIAREAEWMEKQGEPHREQD